MTSVSTSSHRLKVFDDSLNHGIKILIDIKYAVIEWQELDIIGQRLWIRNLKPGHLEMKQ